MLANAVKLVGTSVKEEAAVAVKYGGSEAEFVFGAVDKLAVREKIRPHRVKIRIVGIPKTRRIDMDD